MSSSDLPPGYVRIDDLAAIAREIRRSMFERRKQLLDAGYQQFDEETFIWKGPGDPPEIPPLAPVAAELANLLAHRNVVASATVGREPMTPNYRCGGTVQGPHHSGECLYYAEQFVPTTLPWPRGVRLQENATDTIPHYLIPAGSPGFNSLVVAIEPYEWVLVHVSTGNVEIHTDAVWKKMLEDKRFVPFAVP